MSHSVISCPYGLDSQGLVLWRDDKTLVHPAVAGDLEALFSTAKDAGFSLKIVSGYRSFERQALIWRAKCFGERTVLDHDDAPVDLDRLTPIEIIEAVCLWSAIPGASRHHWGTDFDVIPENLLPQGYKLQLTASEYGENGPFYPFAQWLATYLPSSAFFKPYAVFRGGVGEEPWHISHQQAANEAQQRWKKNTFFELIKNKEIAFYQEIIQNFSSLYRRFVQNEGLSNLS
ncbi:MAG: peptidase M15 [Kangiellaceae bacterium]|nr:peptidase M15 [Kangiellaceae bacterium]|tara:strand:+ start:11124 stop:11816 length:693 start_codon:yes stop_codon:yes gene_type:complete